GTIRAATAAPTPNPTAPAPAPAPPPPPPVTAAQPPAPPPPTAPPSPASVTLSPGAAYVTWNGTAVSPAVAFASVANSLAAVYAYDPWTGTWLRWSPVMDPELQTLRTLVTGGEYWVIARASLVLPLR
ncbi:MAG TPA: hypothetical protein PKD27_12235, partial [Tepidiformaceae bacterium]|nr:hypothetical protein [Tepidiformaceae bacterium]